MGNGYPPVLPPIHHPFQRHAYSTQFYLALLSLGDEKGGSAQKRPGDRSRHRGDHQLQ